MTAPGDPSAPSSVPWPPALLAAGLIGGLLLHNVYPLGFARGFAGVWLGAGLVGAALAIDFWVFAIFKRANTNIRPDRPAHALVTDGPFKWSRNPIYVGNVMILLGVGLMVNSWWFVPMAILFAVLVTRLAIVREEAHLQAQFGDAWADYAAQTRRWI